MATNLVKYMLLEIMHQFVSIALMINLNFLTMVPVSSVDKFEFSCFPLITANVIFNLSTGEQWNLTYRYSFSFGIFYFNTMLA